MYQTARLEKAKEVWRQFIRKQSAFPARHVAIGDPDLDFEQPIDVLRSEALKVFLEHYPKYKHFRVQLLGLFGNLEKFCFSVDRWQKAAEINSPS